MLILVNKTLKSVHDDVVTRIMQAPINLFFDTTPNGTIMERFTSDMGVIEHLLRMCLQGCLREMTNIGSTFFMLSTQNVGSLVVIPILLWYIHKVYSFTNKAKR